MNAQQKKFCEEYVLCYEPTTAYMKAYPESSYEAAKVSACRLLKKDDVMEYVKELQREAVRRYGDIAEFLANELLKDIYELDEDGKHNPGWQKSVDLLSKNLGLQKQDITVKQTTITVDIDE